MGSLRSTIFTSKEELEKSLARRIGTRSHENPESLLFQDLPGESVSLEDFLKRANRWSSSNRELIFCSHVLFEQGASGFFQALKNMGFESSVAISVGSEMLTCSQPLHRIGPGLLSLKILSDREVNQLCKSTIDELLMAGFDIEFCCIPRQQISALSAGRRSIRSRFMICFWSFLAELSDRWWIFRWRVKYRYLPQLRQLRADIRSDLSKPRPRRRLSEFFENPIFATRVYFPAIYWFCFFPFLKVYWYLRFRLSALIRSH